MAAAAIEFQGVSKVYKRWFSEERVEALSNVSFAVAQGEVCAFLGPNGAGKTTSIGILMGFHFANTGTVRVLGHAPGDIRVKEQIGFLPENFAFYKYLTGPKLLRLHRALAGRTAAGDEALIAELLAKVKLAGYENLKIGRYSRGMVQRLGIAQALLCDPQLVILDEPTSGLDPAGRREVLQLLVSLKAEGKTVFLSSHILPEVEQICDRVVILDHGKLIRTGRLNEMLGSNTAVEIVVESLSAEMEGAAVQRGAVIHRTAQGVKVTTDLAHKREVAEALWAGGCDVVSLNPVRSTLEEVFLQTVDGKEAAS
jgi:ABC-2 type transport system ATP-binding protein